jgi:ribonuclease BN (tRNA processing enzyme)
MADFHLTILGSASGLPVPDRAHAALALRRPGEIHLLDAGEGTCSSLLRWKLDPLEVQNIFITHTHPDHCVGIFMLLQYLHMRRSRRPLDIYLPEGAIGAFQGMLNQLYLVNGEIHPRYDLKALQSSHEFGNGLLLETFPTRHLQRWEELNLPGLETRAYSFRVRLGGKALFYSGDVGDFGDVAGNIQPGDLPVLEGAHIDISQVVRWSLDLRLQHLILTHVLPETDWSGGGFLQAARRGGLEIIFAQDGMVFPL